MIEINNLTANKINKDFLIKVAKTVLEGEKNKLSFKKRKLGLSIALIGPSRIRKINKKYLGKNRATDILAFPSHTILEKLKPEISQDIYGLGELVISPREVKKNAKRFKVAFKTELARVLIHGVLHLLGYNHEKDIKSAKKMAEKENYYLLKIFKQKAFKYLSI